MIFHKFKTAKLFGQVFFVYLFYFIYFLQPLHLLFGVLCRCKVGALQYTTFLLGINALVLKGWF